LKDLPKKGMKIEKGEDSAFISEAADCVTLFGGPVKFKNFDELAALVAPYKSPLNLSNIYQFAADNVTSNMTLKRNTCSFDNKCCENLWIAVHNQSTTVTYVPVCHYKTLSKTSHPCTNLPDD
jgi:hypothetical protein